MPSDFDHRQCPNCTGRIMRLMKVQPHRPDGKDGYEQHIYHCSECANISRFVFEVPSRQDPSDRPLTACGATGIPAAAAAFARVFA